MMRELCNESIILVTVCSLFTVLIRFLLSWSSSVLNTTFDSGLLFSTGSVQMEMLYCWNIMRRRPLFLYSIT
jgi:hypothetical protein